MHQMIKPPRKSVDEETLVERRHLVAVIAEAMEMEGVAWPGSGSRADYERLRAARRIAWTRWAVRNAEINDCDMSADGREDGR